MNQGSTETYADDEIDLFELWNNIWEQKWLIAIVTLATTAIGLSYALMSTPVYKSESYFLPPLQQDVQALNMQNMQTYTIDQVYSDFLRNLQSRSLQKQFYDAKDLRSLYSNGEQVKSEHELFTNQFHKKMVLNKPNKKADQTFVSLSFELKNNPELASSLLNEYVTFVFDQTRRQLINDVSFRIKSEIQMLREQIKSKRELAKKKREDEVSRLQTDIDVKVFNLKQNYKNYLVKVRNLMSDRKKQILENLRIAEKLGIKENLLISKGNQGVNVLTTAQPAYLKGVKTLKAELESIESRTELEPFYTELRNMKNQIENAKYNFRLVELNNRENDDPYIPALRGLQEQIAFMEKLLVDPNKLNVARIDLLAETPDKPIKPKKALIVAVAMVLGLMLGVFIALIRSAVRNRQLQKSEMTTV